MSQQPDAAQRGRTRQQPDRVANDRVANDRVTSDLVASESADAELEHLLERCTFDDAGSGRLACAVSGGADSAALLVLACQFARRTDAAATAVTAVHFDHGIRADGAVEAARVEALCNQIGASLSVVRLDLSDGPNLQARARAARHAALGPDALLGHTADDQAETVLLHLMRGGAVDALAAMRGHRRPLLGLRRADTERVCELVGYEPVDDPSNTDRRYWRSRVRHELIPLLCNIAERDVVPLLARAADLAAADTDLLDALAAEIDPTSSVALRDAPTALARRAIRAWLRTDHPPDAATVERVLAVARHTHRATDIGGGRRVIRSAGELRIEPPRRLGSAHVTTAPDPQPPHSDLGTMLAGDPGVGDVLVSGAEIAQRVAELGAQISADYAGREPLLVAVLKGAVMFASDLSRAIDLPVEMDFMAVSSYGSSTRSSGVVRILKDLDIDIAGRDVILVEDIVESGLTLSYLRRSLLARSPASLAVCSLLTREHNGSLNGDVDYIGFHLPPVWVIGYGLDLAQKYRNLTEIRAYDSEAAESS